MRSGQDAPADRSASPRLLVVLSLFLVLGFLPPEVHGESLAGAALLLVVLAIVPGGRAGSGLLGPFCVAVLCGGILARSAQAPGASIEPLTVGLLALAAAAHARSAAGPLEGDARIPWAIAIAGGLTGVRAVWEKLFGLARLAEAVEATQALPDRDVVLARIHEGRAYAQFATPAALGCFLAMAAAVTWALRGDVSRKTAPRVVLWVLLALHAAGILASSSATAAGALAVAAVLSLARLRERSLAPLLAVAAVLVVVVALLRGSRVLSLDDPASPWRLRAGNARVAIEMTRDHPWLGVGPGGFGEVFPSYRREGDNESRHVHDLPLELVAELGIPLGLLVSAAFLVAFLRPVLARARPAAPAWHKGAHVALAVLAIQSLADFTAFLPSLLWTACLLWGIAARGREPLEPERAVTRWGAVAATALLAALAAGVGLSGNAQRDCREALALGDRETARSDARRAAALAPWDVDARMLHAQALLDDPATLRAAALQAERAVAADPIRPAARELRSRLRLAAGDLPGAYADLVEAARLYPMRPEYATRRDALEGLLSAASPAGAERE
jgi:O-antigen ligase